MENVKEIIQEEVMAKEENKTKQSVTEVVRNRSFLQPLALTCTLSMVQLLSGSDQLETYILVIFRDTGVMSGHLAILYQVRDRDRNSLY